MLDAPLESDGFFESGLSYFGERFRVRDLVFFLVADRFLAADTSFLDGERFFAPFLPSVPADFEESEELPLSFSFLFSLGPSRSGTFFSSLSNTVSAAFFFAAVSFPGLEVLEVFALDLEREPRELCDELEAFDGLRRRGGCGAAALTAAARSVTARF